MGVGEIVKERDVADTSLVAFFPHIATLRVSLQPTSPSEQGGGELAMARSLLDTTAKVNIEIISQDHNSDFVFHKRRME